MTASNPISLDAFATAVESLDRDAFAALVGEAYAVTADAAAVDPPRVAVSSGGRRTEILVVSDAAERVRGESADAVAVASDSLLDGGVPECDVAVVTPADLRQRLLYAASPAAANAITERILDLPVRSEAYDGVTNDDATGGDATNVGAGDGATSGGTTNDGDTTAGDTTDGAANDDGSDSEDGPLSRVGWTGAADAAADVTTAGVESSSERSRTGDSRTDESQTAGASSDRAYPRTLLAAVAVVALLAAGVGGAFVAATVGTDGPGGIAGVEGDDGSGTGTADGSGTGTADGGGTETADGDAVESVDGEPTAGPADEVVRNTAPAPTCERSALQVVQIQLNALRYNDNATNDGIRTLRAFASPENREVVGSVSDYAALFETERYAPMLTYDTARYSVPEVDGGTAEIQVVTREDGGVTGRYEFRLELIAGGSQGTNDTLGDVDDCWMTDSVASSSE
ncbi:hypothetical protein EKH57_09535 [Halorubrum sp. BOL3-1]|uniref:hypothetical protein n=1 Tax=Halorubrum sp. BOL3-1 TaxID=2497325 RepID=UPI00100507BE|nr:hypothetical protein [Halorubrum sp. BOL3-1]QAU12942.1 hypothetical protein EKH57_09535 [Halorubrum sp. BOL3-1]